MIALVTWLSNEVGHRKLGNLEPYFAASVPARVEFVSLASFGPGQHGFDYRFGLP